MTITKNERRNELLKMVWKDPAERSMDKLADAATKWATLGVPHQVLWEQAGATPDDVVRWQTIAAQESMQKTLFAPPTTPTPPPGEPAPEPAPA
jgi:hypothetical protein